MTNETLEKLREAIRDVTGFEVEFNEGDNLIDDVGLDSLDMMELLLLCEEEFCSIPDEELEAILTIGDAVRCIDRNLARVPA